MSKTKRPTPVELKQAHVVLSRERPAPEDGPDVWLAYYRRSAAVYAEVAEIDRWHHHEALYWSAREARKAREIEDHLRKSTQGGANRDA
ncbi:AMED_5909 family protein [Actinophytocola sp.]|uniref:AMED_5909 family protein n=1 Tax=Actinophytocola sp. TaxID=1872138 RepID=UPI003D6B3F4E